MFIVQWRTYDDKTFTRTDVVRIEYAEIDESDVGGPADDKQILLWYDDGTGERFPFDELAEMRVRAWRKGWTEKVDRIVSEIEDYNRKKDAAGVSEQDARNAQHLDR